MADLISGVRFHFQDDSLSKMEQIHRLTREQETILFVDRLWVAAQDCTHVCDAEKDARARLVQATNYYLLGHAAAYTIHVLAQQKSTVMVNKMAEPNRKEDVATGGSAGSFLITKVMERQAFLEKMIEELADSTCPFTGLDANEIFKKQLDEVKAHTQGHDRDKGLDLSKLKSIVGYSEEKAVGLT